MRYLLAGLMAVVVSGCTFGAATCSVDGDCGGGSCVEGFCVAAAGGGSGDGGASDGGSGGGTGGGMGGGDGGTGGGGGAVATCVRTCAAWQTCVADADGGTCEVLSLSFLAPDAGAVVSPGASVRVAVRLTDSLQRPVNNGTGVPLDAGVSGANLRFEVDAGAYAAAMTMPTVSGPVTLTAGWPGALEATRTLTVDAEGPVFAVTAIPAASYGTGQDGGVVGNDPELAGAYRRDDSLVVEVTSNDADVDAATVQVALRHQGTASGLSVTTGTSCPSPTTVFCRRFPVELWRVPFEAIRGQVDVSVAGRDSRGNAQAASSTGGTFHLTRWRWSTRITNGSIRASPAMTNQGHLAVGVTSGSDPGVTLLSADGGVSWRAGSASVEASPAVGANHVGTEFVFFQQRDARDALVAASVSSGLEEPHCGQVSSNTALGLSLAVVGDGSGEVGVVGTQKSNDGGIRIAVARPFSSSNTCSGSPALDGAFPGNLVHDGVDTIVYPDSTGRLTKRPLTTSGFGMAAQFPPASLGSGVVNGLALLSGGTQVAGGGGGPGVGALFSFAIATGSGTTVVAATPVTAPVVTHAGDLIAGFRVGSALEVRRYTSGGMQVGTGLSTSASFPVANPGVSSPLLGADDGLFFVANSGYVVAARQSTLGLRYQGLAASSLNLGVVSASPTLDCNRDHPGSSTGILYFATENGHVVSLIVDSRGLDATAQWPKYQHDVRNTGNAGTPLLACPN